MMEGFGIVEVVELFGKCSDAIYEVGNVVEVCRCLK